MIIDYCFSLFGIIDLNVSKILRFLLLEKAPIISLLQSLYSNTIPFKTN